MLATDRFVNGGLFLLDEPEAGLSFETQLVLVGHLAELATDPRSQVVVATHSPIVAATPGAQILQLRRSWPATRQLVGAEGGRPIPEVPGYSRGLSPASQSLTSWVAGRDQR